MADLRRVSDSLRETIRHANHGRIEYPWQKAAQDASASKEALEPLTATGPRLDSLDRPAIVAAVPAPLPRRDSQEALADTGAQTPKLRVGKPSESQTGIEATAPATPPALQDAKDVAIPRTRSESARLKIDLRTQQVAELKRTAELPPKSPEAAVFAKEARQVLHEASKEMIAIPREIADESSSLPAAAPPPGIEPTSGARKRAATLPPTPASLLRRPPTIQPPIAGRRPPTIPPGEPKMTLPGPLVSKPPAQPDLPGVAKFIPSTLAGLPPSPPPAPAISSDAAITLPPVPPRRLPAMIIDEESPETTQPRMRAPSANDDDAPSSRDDTSPNIELPLPAPAQSLPNMAAKPPWRAGLTGRIDAHLDDDFGTETPVVAPTKAELQALLGTPPDVTKEQSLEELERLHMKARERRSEPEILTRRPYPTAEVDENDIEAAIEVAPPARRTAIGVAKRKPTEK
jgi:hypothetical protein